MGLTWAKMCETCDERRSAAAKQEQTLTWKLNILQFWGVGSWWENWCCNMNSLTLLSGKDVEKTLKCEFGVCEDEGCSMFIFAWNLDTSSTSLLDLVVNVGGWPVTTASGHSLCRGCTHRGPCATHGMWLGTVLLLNSVRLSNDGFLCTMRALGMWVKHLCLHRHKTHVQVVAALPSVTSSPGLWLCSSSCVSRSCWRTAGTFFKGTISSQRFAQAARIANFR